MPASVLSAAVYNPIRAESSQRIDAAWDARDRGGLFRVDGHNYAAVNGPEYVLLLWTHKATWSDTWLLSVLVCSYKAAEGTHQLPGVIDNPAPSAGVGDKL